LFSGTGSALRIPYPTRRYSSKLPGCPAIIVLSEAQPLSTFR
jgi:hypothetical protein